MYKFWIVTVTLMVVLLTACTPPPAPAPTPAAPAAPAPMAAAPSQPAPISGEDAAWAKVVAAAKKEGKLVTYSFEMGGDVGTALTKAFKEKYGISLEIVSIGSTLVALERIRTEYRIGQQAADMLDSSIRGTNQVMAEGFSASIADLPAFKESGIWVTPPNSWDRAGRQMITHLGLTTFFINTKLVPPAEEPKSWYDLLDPKWKGQIIIAHPSISSAIDAYYLILVGRNILEKDYFERLGRQEIKFASGGARGPAEALARGEGKMSLSSNATALSFIREGAPIKALGLKEGVIGGAYGVTMLSKGPHPNATRVFINWLFSPEGASIYARARSGNSVRKGVPDFTPEAAKTSLEKLHMVMLEDEDKSMENWRSGFMAKTLGALKK